MLSIKTLVCVAVFAILISGIEVSSQNFGDACGPNQPQHCATNVGLICAEADKKCACGSGPLNHEYNFEMEWDSGKSLCVAKNGSACIGTGTNPVAEGQKSVQCKEGVCIQLESMPLGVGVCGEGADNGNSGAESMNGFAMILPVVMSCLLWMRN